MATTYSFHQPSAGRPILFRGWGIVVVTFLVDFHLHVMGTPLNLLKPMRAEIYEGHVAWSIRKAADGDVRKCIVRFDRRLFSITGTKRETLFSTFT